MQKGRQTDYRVFSHYAYIVCTSCKGLTQTSFSKSVLEALEYESDALSRSVQRCAGYRLFAGHKARVWFPRSYWFRPEISSGYETCHSTAACEAPSLRYSSHKLDGWRACEVTVHSSLPGCFCNIHTTFTLAVLLLLTSFTPFFSNYVSWSYVDCFSNI
jgi:hypothetical protein